MDKVKIGVVGVGHMGQYHVNILSSLPRADLVGICDVRQDVVEAVANKYNTKPFTDCKKLFKKVDAVVIAVPTHLHYKIATEALEAGLHVLVEKPITRTVRYAEKLVEHARIKNKVLMVGHVERFNAAVQELGNVVKNPYMIETRRFNPRSDRKFDVGVVLDLMIHDIDIVLNLVKSPVTDIFAVGKKIYTSYEDIASATLVFENGCVAHFAASRITEHKIRTLEVTQEDSYVLLDYATQDITIYRRSTADYFVRVGEIKYIQEALIERVFIHKENPLKLELQHFIDLVLGNSEPMVKNEVDISALKVTRQIMDKLQIAVGEDEE